LGRGKLFGESKIFQLPRSGHEKSNLVELILTVTEIYNQNWRGEIWQLKIIFFIKNFFS